MAIKVDEMSNVGKMIRWNRAEKMAIVVVLIVPVDGPAIEPREIVDNFNRELVTLVDLVKKFSHSTGRVGGVLKSCVEDVKEGLRLGINVSESPLRTCVNLHFYSFRVPLVDVVEVGLAVVIVDVGDGGVFVLVGTSQIHLAVNGEINLHVLEKVLVGGLELVQPLQNVFLNHK